LQRLRGSELLSFLLFLLIAAPTALPGAFQRRAGRCWFLHRYARPMTINKLSAEVRGL
jgi:hypothetical protein